MIASTSRRERTGRSCPSRNVEDNVGLRVHDRARADSFRMGGEGLIGKGLGESDGHRLHLSMSKLRDG